MQDLPPKKLERLRNRTKKFSAEDLQYFQKRNEFASEHVEIPLWFSVDNWPLLAGIVNISRSLAIYELVKKVIHLPGHFCELGCYNGTNLVYLAKLLRIFRPQSCAEVIGFDSFEGLQVFSDEKDPSPVTRGTYVGNVLLLEDVLQLYDLRDCVELVKGDIEKTLPAFLEERKDIRFSFIYLDVDLYSPTKVGLELLYPRLIKGGVIVLDEYNMAAWPGETSAVHDVLGQDVVMQSVPFTRRPTAYIIK